MKVFETSFRVRYSETDQMGFVYYGNYTQYYEVGRVEALRELGMSYHSIEKDFGVMMPVVHMEMRFYRAAKYDDLIRVCTSIASFDENEIIFDTEVYGPSKKLLNKGQVTLWYIARDSKKRIALPDELKSRLAAL